MFDGAYGMPNWLLGHGTPGPGNYSFEYRISDHIVTKKPTIWGMQILFLIFWEISCIIHLYSVAHIYYLLCGWRSFGCSDPKKRKVELIQGYMCTTSWFKCFTESILRQYSQFTRIASCEKSDILDTLFLISLYICVCQDNDWCLPGQFRESCSSRSRGGACETAACVFVEMRSPELKFYFQLYNFFGLLWGLFFISGFNQMILSFCFATWYWTYNKANVPFFTLTYSIYITVRWVTSRVSCEYRNKFVELSINRPSYGTIETQRICRDSRYHLGTIAVGSFLIATCGFIRALLERVHKTVKHADGVVSECAMWSLRCCFWALQKFLIFISNNAYIMCAIMGRGFFSSASESFGLLTRNILRVVVLDKVSIWLEYLQKEGVTGCWRTCQILNLPSESKN